MARVDQDKDDRHQETIVKTQIVECPDCEQEFEAFFDTGEYDEEMIDSEITADLTCPKCMHNWEAEYEGYTAHTDAG